MNRFIPLLFSGLFIAGSLSAQDYSLCNQVIGSAGRFITVQNQKWTYTIGETVIPTFVDPVLDVTLTQGFHQPEFCAFVSTASPDLDAWEIEVFPNPATSVFHFRCQPQQSAGLILDVFDLHGRRMFGPYRWPGSQNSLDILCEDWQAGVYLLRIAEPSSQANGFVRLVKL